MIRRTLSLLALVASVAALTACGDDGSAETSGTSGTSAAPSTVPVTTGVPRADDDAFLAQRFPDLEGFTYGAPPTDTDVLAFFADALAAPNAPEVFERHAVRSVVDAEDEPVAVVFAARFTTEYRDDTGEVLARSFTSRELAGERVYLAELRGGGDGASAYRYMWFADGIGFMIHGIDQTTIEAILTEVIAAS